MCFDTNIIIGNYVGICSCFQFGPKIYFSGIFSYLHCVTFIKLLKIVHGLKL